MIHFVHNFCMFIFLLHIFFGEVSIKIFDPFSKQVVFLRLNFKKSLYKFRIMILYHMCLLQIFLFFVLRGGDFKF